MPLMLSRACAADAARIAEIHMAAFGQNGMLLAQFPTPAVRRELQQAIETKASADILDPQITVLVVQERGVGQPFSDGKPPQNNGHIISFAKWIHPVAAGENYTETAWLWPEGTMWEVLDAWTRKVEETERKVLDGSPCYRKSQKSNMFAPPQGREGHMGVQNLSIPHSHRHIYPLSVLLLKGTRIID